MESFDRREELLKSLYTEEITYDEVYKSEDNLWNFLFYRVFEKQGERL